MRQVVAGAAMLLAAVSCRGDVPGLDGGVWTPETAWRLELVWRIGGDAAEGPEAFGGVAGIAVDDQARRLYVLDRQAQEIRAFGPDGAWLRSFGRAGGGPGEFTSASGVAVEPGTGNVWVVDGAAGQYAVFDSSGRTLATLRRPQRVLSYGFSWDGRFTPDGTLWDFSSVELGPADAQAYLRVDTSHGFADTLVTPAWERPYFSIDFGRSGARFFAVPFAPRVASDISPSHEVSWARTDRYEILTLGRHGDTLRTMARPWRPIPIPESQRAIALEPIRTAFERAGRALDESLIPTNANALWGFTFDPDGHLWVMPLGGPSRYDVFDPAGIFLGTVPVDGHGWFAGRTTIVSRDYLTRVVADSLGSAIVERFRIVRP